MKHFGWYSPSAHNTVGFAIYTDPGGKPVKVTLVTTYRNKDVLAEHGHLWPDMQYVGEVAAFVKSHSTPVFGIGRKK